MNKVLNCPEDGYEYEFRVAIENEDGDFEWYCNCKNGYEAEKIAKEVGGVILHNIRLAGVQKKK